MGISRLPINSYPDDYLANHVECIFNSLSDGVCITDDMGMIQFINYSFGKTFGLSSSRVLGQPIQQLLRTDIIKNAIKQKIDADGELLYHHQLLHVSINVFENQFGIKGFNIMTKEIAHEEEQIIEPTSLVNPFEKIIGNNHVLVKALIQAKKAAKKDVTVLLRGESGTGKELIAKQIHNHSMRSDEAFVAINCAAIPENLIESELFGHEAGAFTGANGLKKGHFEMAEGGTIFLDEIGDLPHHLQVKLLRVIQERVIRRVGGSKEIPIDVRLITATHHDLETMVEEKRFRRDLFYRLNVVAITLNPLRERVDDLQELFMFFLDKMQKRHHLSGITLSDEALEALMAHDWPGNIRELKNTLERAVIMVEDNVITINDLPTSVTHRYDSCTKHQKDYGLFNLRLDGSLATLDEYEQAIIKHAVDHYGSFHAAGKALGINHKTVASKYRKIVK